MPSRAVATAGMHKIQDLVLAQWRNLGNSLASLQLFLGSTGTGTGGRTGQAAKLQHLSAFVWVRSGDRLGQALAPTGMHKNQDRV